MEDFDKLQQQLDKNAVRLDGATILALDPSSNCTGYCLASVNFKTKTATITKTGVLWFGKDWEHAKKYYYVTKALLEYFYVVEKIDHVVIERYSINPNKMSGVLVNPELQGAIKGALHEYEISVDPIPPQTWRKQLGISKNKTTGDYKGPTKTYVSSVITGIPSKVKSNITDKERTTPSDLYDSVAIMLGWLKKLNITVIPGEIKSINPHLGFPMDVAI